MRQLCGPSGPPKDSRALKAARGLVILAALISVFALWCLRIGLVSFCLLAVLSLAAGLYVRSAALIIFSAAALLLVSRIPGRELARSFSASRDAALSLAKAAYRLYTIAMAFILVAGFFSGDEGLIQTGLYGLIPWAIRRCFAWLSILNPYQDRHIAGTTLIHEQEAIRRAEAIRFPGGR